MVYYTDARLDGPLKLWNEKKERILYAEFKKGKKHGLVCLFEHQRPRLVQEWTSAKLQGEYFVRYGGPSPAVLNATDLSDDEADTFANAKEQLRVLEKELQANEARLKRELAEWARKEDRKAKQQKLAELAPSRHDRAMGRIDDSNAARGAAWESSWRTALNRSGF
jgi:hypothetical protein